MQPAELDLSILSLFAQSDIFVKSIMLLLLVLSFWVWTIWFAKGASLRKIKRKASNFEEAFMAGEDLTKLYKGADINKADHPMAKVFMVGIKEWQDAEDYGEPADDLLRAGVVSRVRRRMDATLTRELEKMETGLPFLATVGSIAPFIGLLGTVWGIMNSFQAIGVSKNTSLAFVAPGIAEALLATAMGLFAAIPAVVAYNKLSMEVGKYAARLEAFTMELLVILERKIEREREEAEVKPLKVVKGKK